MTRFLTWLTLLFLTACAPKTYIAAFKTYPAQPESADFAVFEPTDSVDLSQKEKLGTIQFKTALAPHCDYLALLDSATHIAKRWGGNALKIEKHLAPNWVIGSTCHRIQASAYRLDSLDDYLHEIPWSDTRRLQISDFKADTANRPFQAATSTYIRVFWELQPIQKEAVVQSRTVFERRRSYFKPVDANWNLLALAHEQGHFDIAEVYARKLRKAISERSFTIKNWNTEIQKMYEANGIEMSTEQDRYDHDIYRDQQAQPGWLERIRADLDALKDFREPKQILKLTN